MRIVADTNTVLSGLLWQGPPRQLLELGRKRTVTLCTRGGLTATYGLDVAALIKRCGIKWWAV